MSSELQPIPAPAPAPVPTNPPMSAAAPASKPRPNDPLMGSTEETYSGSESFYYAFGGAPLPDWSGIADKSKRRLTDLCFRPLDPVSGQKSSVYRTTGLVKPYTQDQKLAEFQLKVWDHLEKYGLDTVGYLPDPSSPTSVLSVVTHHARFTGDLTKAAASSTTLFARFDSWDRKHDLEAKEFLLNSLDDEVKRGLEPFVVKEDAFAMTWLKLVHYLVTTTAKTYDDMKEVLRLKRPQNYSGQDIEQMSGDVLVLAKELDNAGYYVHSLTLNIVDSFLSASQDPQGTFHHAMNTLRTKVDDMVQETVFLSKTDQDLKFASAKLTYTDVCLKAVKCYRDLKHTNKWEPAKLPKDRQAPAANLSRADVLMLIDNMKQQKGKAKGEDAKSKSGKSKHNKSPSSKRGCFNCGGDHLIKDCTKPKGDSQSQKAKRQSNMAKWKLESPKSGEPQTKSVNGRTFHWCAKCENWSPTHGTSGHTGKATPSTNSTPSTYLASLDASAWMAAVDLVPTARAPVIAL